LSPNLRNLVFAAAAVLLVVSASPAAAAHSAAEKATLSIKVTEQLPGEDGKGAGTFTLLGSSTADSDTGTLTFTESYGAYRKSADGLPFQALSRTETLRGKRGTLVLRSSHRVFLVGIEDEDDFIATGTWKIVSGTGRYANLKGNGGAVGILRAKVPHSMSHVLAYRYEGYTTTS
jgi:hypothetical protein